MHDQCLLGRHSLCFSGAWLDASSQSLTHPGLRVFHRSWICYSHAGLDIDRAPSCLRRGVALCSDLEWFAIQHLGNYRSSVRWFVGPACRSEFCLCYKWRLLPLGCCGNSAMETTNPAGKASVGELFRILRDDKPLRS